MLSVRGREEWQTGAEFSPCRVWRYSLWRIWGNGGLANSVAFVGLNPSTADETQDDPTIRRCIGFAKRWGYDGYLMLNAYAFRATDPKDMKSAGDPVGEGNDAAFLYYRCRVALIVAAWGVHCEPQRGIDVCQLLDRTVYCLGKTKAGCPKHPLYLRGDSALEPFWNP